MKITNYKSEYKESWLRCRALSYMRSQFQDEITGEKDDFSSSDRVADLIDLIMLNDDQEVAGISSATMNSPAYDRTFPYALDHSLHGSNIDTFAIHPDYQGRGFGKQLLTETFKQLKAHDVDYVNIYTRDDPAPNALYQSVGGRLVFCSYIVSGRLKDDPYPQSDKIILKQDEHRLLHLAEDGSELPYVKDYESYVVTDKQFLNLFEIESITTEYDYNIDLRNLTLI